ncbi:DEAD/DEAH box helicase [Myroides odoratimimus]|uniref:DEAD/DEAH box helicase n=1 Tax=Myroides odoratimimus TaxID=76832 RepID=UPI002574B7EC|nr:DEAD/DEAH box helicase [Myroides odoratimimus]MDM1508316.1 DEAD/DEAH box helicase [Myroides odoratimimus]
MTIKDLIKDIPTGTKRSCLEGIYLRGLENYYKDNVSNLYKDNISIDDLISNEFYNIVSNKRNSIINDLRNFCIDKLQSIIDVSLSDSAIRKQLIIYFNLEIKDDKNQVKEELCEVSKVQFRLHDFQERIRRTTLNHIFNSKKRFLIHMPTGAGKTRTASEIMIDFIRMTASKALLYENFKIIWIAQSNELCEQAFGTFNQLYNLKGTTDITYGHFYGSHSIDDSILDKPAVVFCSIQKLLIHYTNDLWKRIKDDTFLVIVDEAHRSVASRWVNVLDSFVGNNSTYLLGLTATPGSGGGVQSTSTYNLASYYGNNKVALTNEKYQEINSPIQYLIKQGFLANIKRIDIQSNSFTLTEELEYNEESFKFSNSTLESLAIDGMRNSSIINIIKGCFKENKKILVFTCGISHNKILKTILTDLDIKCETVDANTKDRARIIDEFKYKDLNVLLNYGVLTTGFDAPKTDVCIIARPVESIVMYSQMVGRILRGPKNNGNEENTLYTIKDNFNHGSYDEMFNTFNDFYK